MDNWIDIAVAVQELRPNLVSFETEAELEIAGDELDGSSVGLLPGLITEEQIAASGENELSAHAEAAGGNALLQEALHLGVGPQLALAEGEL